MARRLARTPRRPQRTAREAALALVARRLFCEAELRVALTRRGYPKPAIDDALDLVRTYGYVNDEAYADAALREAARSGRGPLWVTARLTSRGVAETIIQNAERAAAADAAARAQALVSRRFGDPSRLTPANQQRAYRFLLSRGFSAESALNVLGAP